MGWRVILCLLTLAGGSVSAGHGHLSSRRSKCGACAGKTPQPPPGLLSLEQYFSAQDTFLSWILLLMMFQPWGCMQERPADPIAALRAPDVAAASTGFQASPEGAHIAQRSPRPK